MLSILIPTYNYSVFSLVKEIESQCISCKIDYEILVIDDCSTLFLNENQIINSFNNCSYIQLNENIGRSKIRNLLSKKANFDWLLFLDSDTFPCQTNFIQNYISYINHNFPVIYGGIKYKNEIPSKEQLLRWVYGRKREALSMFERDKNPYLRFLTLNFLIHKKVFEKISFNEAIPNFRHEDTLFSYQLCKANIAIKHIDNTVYHLGLDTTEKFIEKDTLASSNLKLLIDNNLLPYNYVSLSKVFYKLKKYKLDILVKLIISISLPLINKNLRSNKPNLFLFDLYRLHCYIELNR